MASMIFICIDCFLIMMYLIFRISKIFRPQMHKSIVLFWLIYLAALALSAICALGYYYVGGLLNAHGFEMYSIPGFVYHFAPLFIISPLSKLLREIKQV